MNKQSVESHFDNVAKGYEKASISFPWIISRSIERFFVKKALKECDLTNVLEMGCGSGFYSRVLLENGAKNLTVIDCAKNMLEQIRIPSINKIHSDFDSFKTDCKFSTIISIGSLEFCKNPELIIKKYLEYLSVDGCFLFMIPRPSILGNLYKRHHEFINLPIRLLSEELIKKSITPSHTVIYKMSVPPFSSIYRVTSL
jgi:SAM-dependent methyltransferase